MCLTMKTKAPKDTRETNDRGCPNMGEQWW